MNFVVWDLKWILFLIISLVLRLNMIMICVEFGYSVMVIEFIWFGSKVFNIWVIWVWIWSLVVLLSFLNILLVIIWLNIIFMILE